MESSSPAFFNVLANAFPTSLAISPVSGIVNSIPLFFVYSCDSLTSSPLAVLILSTSSESFRASTSSDDNLANVGLPPLGVSK